MLRELKKLFERREPRRHPDPSTLDQDGLRDLFTRKHEIPDSKVNDLFSKQGGEQYGVYSVRGCMSGVLLVIIAINEVAKEVRGMRSVFETHYQLERVPVRSESPYKRKGVEL